MTVWQEPKPLRTGPGQALAVEVTQASSPEEAVLVVRGALGALADATDQRPALTGPDEANALRDVYLRGLAAAAIIADGALGTRHFTHAIDFSVHARQADFLPPDALTLGLITQAAGAMFQGEWIIGELAARADGPPPWPLSDDHPQTRRKVLEHLAHAARLRMNLTGPS